jgi:ADP-ribosylation factor protein 1
MGCPLFKASKLKKLEADNIKRKILMVGLDAAGKTSILYRLKLSEFLQTSATIGLNVETIMHKQLELLVFDVGGGARSLWSYYFDNLDAIIFVVDSTDSKRVAIVREEILRITELLKEHSYVMLLYLNKQDSKEKMEFTQLIKEIGIHEVDHPVDIIVQKCTALTGEGLLEGLDKMADYLLKHKSNFHGDDADKKVK